MKQAARRNDRYDCKSHGSGAIDGDCEAGILINGLPAARLASKATCPHAPDMIGAGASAVLFNGLPAARVADTTLHKGVIVEPCARGVVIDSPTFSIPSNMKIDGDRDFQSKVVRDLYFISTTRSGHELLARIEKAGQQVIIQPPPIDPTNLNTTPTVSATYSRGTPCSSTTQWNPDHQTITRGPNGELIRISPQQGLMHEMVHALAYVEGTVPERKKDPRAPPNRLDETHAIGIGTYSDAHPTENTFRDDLGLQPHRAQQDPVDLTGLTSLPDPQNFRPGTP